MAAKPVEQPVEQPLAQVVSVLPITFTVKRNGLCLHTEVATAKLGDGRKIRVLQPVGGALMVQIPDVGDPNHWTSYGIPVEPLLLALLTHHDAAEAGGSDV